MNLRERLYLICYDICEPRRLSRVARFLEKHACRVQYSVFAIQITPVRLTLLMKELSRLIDPTEDDVRAYPLPHEAHVDLLGTQMFPDDILLIRNGRNMLRLGAKHSEADSASSKS